MILCWTEDAWDDYVHWQTQDRRMFKRINMLLSDMKRDPFAGIGKPEALRWELQGAWSRRIDQVNRIIYTVEEDRINIISARDHTS